MAAARDFFDSNVLVYLVDGASPTKQALARRLVAEALTRQSAVISFQVVQEALHVLTRKFAVTLQPQDAADFLREVLAPLWQVQPDAALYTQALDVKRLRGFSFYDSLIIAAALRAGCTRLLTEDLQHGQRIDALTVINPFR